MIVALVKIKRVSLWVEKTGCFDVFTANQEALCQEVENKCSYEATNPPAKEKHNENDDLNNPTDKTNSDGSPSTFVIKRLSDGNDHRYQHPNAANEIMEE